MAGSSQRYSRGRIVMLSALRWNLAWQRLMAKEVIVESDELEEEHDLIRIALIFNTMLP